MWNYKPTLKGRVTLWVTVLALSLFILLSLLTIMITLSKEDSMIHSVLRNVDKGTLSLDSHVREVSFEELFALGYQHANKNELLERVGGFGEFPSGDNYYHFMVLPNSVLLIESTTFVASSTDISAIIQFLLKAFLPFFIAAFFLSRMIANRALSPFDSLKASFLKADKTSADIKRVNLDIKESDVKQIADELVLALEQKEQVLEQQILFNQGVSHELRTPLQVMTHAIELIGLKNPNVKEQDSYQRLVNSLGRMHRTSEAMLWLTSAVEPTKHTLVNTCLANLNQEVRQTFSNHGLVINVTEHAQLLLPIPEEVFEFILFNLAQNAVHHAREVNGTKRLEIEVGNNAICFKNLINESDVDSYSLTNNFGLGSGIITKLCQRFGLREEITNSDNIYQIKISTN